MPQIQAFRGLRYDLGHVGSLSDVIAPPYDVIDSELQDALYKRHPANVIRLILNRDEPGDDDNSNRYTRAARFMKSWRRDGLMTLEADPAIYVYHQTFEYGGRQFARRGFMARIRLERFGEGNIYPHEETHSAAKEDRLKLTRACRANLSQIFGIYPDASNEAQEILEREIIEQTPLEATDHLGVVHRIWPVSDVKKITDASAAIATKPMYIADGHHRYETACNYRDELAEASNLAPDHPAQFVLMMCVSMHDPGMIVLPTHRLFRGLPPMSSDELVAKLGDRFTARIAGEGADLAESVWESIEVEGEQGTLGLFAARDQRWVVAKITENGKQMLASLASDHSSDWHGLGVSILHRLVVDTLLNAPSLPKPRYVHLIDEVVAGLNDDAFQLAALVMPATLDHIRSISEFGERMPAKSTYFYPKLLSGLVINAHE
ncbi:MAG: DUF1015 domain-containing protein [Planctomycetes bacterium]|nr:DUF1015 domain-containing protein [Planctomycetota bacterium]